MILRERIIAALAEAAAAVAGGGDPGEISLGVPPTPALGDFSTDVAINLARGGARPPQELASRLIAAASFPPGLVDRLEAAPSGIINLWLRAGWLDDAVREAREGGPAYGRTSDLGEGRPVLLEFVSANPTVELTVAHARGAAVGQALAGVLEAVGYRVEREFYVNDAGRQMERFARAVEAEYLQQSGASGRRALDAYPGGIARTLAAAIREQVGNEVTGMERAGRLRRIAQLARAIVAARHREALQRFGVAFDAWRSEEQVLASGLLGDVLERLRAAGRLYEEDGALWLRTSACGDSADRPLVRSDGNPTYIAGDLAYHEDKFRRGFSRIIDLLGPDHAPYRPRTLAALRALGVDLSRVDVLVLGPVTVRLEELAVEEPGHASPLADVTSRIDAGELRRMLLAAPLQAPLELDAEHPPARLAEIRRVLEAVRAAAPGGPGPISAADAAAAACARLVAALPDAVRAAARGLDPHPLLRLAEELAVQTGALLENGDAPAGLVEASTIALENTLAVLGLDARPREGEAG
jgi:arginyl-tRNA synthetase